MSETGSGYLETTFRDDSRELRRTRDLIQRVASTFAQLASDGAFPYEAEHNKAIVPSYRYSPSTNAMILFALAAISGKMASDCPLLPGLATKTFAWSPDATKAFKLVWERLLAETEKITKRYVFTLNDETKQSHISWSKSFGWDDPFTLTWILELMRSELTRPQDELRKAIETRAQERASSALERPGRFLTWIPDEKLPKELFDELEDKGMVRRTGYTSLDHAFPAVRFIHLFQAVTGRESASVAMARFTETRVHGQLSRAEIRNGEFDPSELVFSLEGLLRVNPRAVGRALIDRAFGVIRDSQRHDPYWRPVKPFVSTPQGHVLFPLSVETANSLLRCCALVRTHLGDPQLFSRYVGLFNVYADWLHARYREGTARVGERLVPFAGWHSEHVHLHEGIHLWETSQVLLFLTNYASMLDDHLAQSSLGAAGLTVTEPWKRDQKFWHVEYWEEKNRDVGEPLLDLSPGSALRAFEFAGKWVVEPRPPPVLAVTDIDRRIDEQKPHPSSPEKDRRGKEKTAHFSLLLYGPPGTGKTTFAEEICKALRWPLITITPSDFIRGGESQVEERAKMIFEVLSAQHEVVVLFDEIDRMLLSRDSKQYGAQGDMFQFMTPSMLTKLRDLRKLERIIFLIATNYAERIDAAAKRRGRIDAQVLVPPPDLGARKAIIRNLVAKWARRTGASLPADIDQRTEAVARTTSLMVFGELKQLIDDAAMKDRGNTDGGKLLDLIQVLAAESVAAISIRSYESRFPTDSDQNKGPDGGQKPFDEFLVVVYLVVQTGRALTLEERKLVDRVMEALGLELDMPHASKEEVRTLLKKKLNDVDVTEVLVSRLAP